MQSFIQLFRMESKVKIFGHAIHPMLVSFPITFYTVTVICLIGYYFNNNVAWYRLGFLSNCAAVITAGFAALFGIIDWLAIPSTHKAKSTGLQHLTANVFALGFFTANAAIQSTQLKESHPPVVISLMLTLAGFLCTIYAGFKGWKLVQKHHIGIDLTTLQEDSAKENEEVKMEQQIFSRKEP